MLKAIKILNTEKIEIKDLGNNKKVVNFSGLDVTDGMGGNFVNCASFDWSVIDCIKNASKFDIFIVVGDLEINKSNGKTYYKIMVQAIFTSYSSGQQTSVSQPSQPVAQQVQNHNSNISPYDFTGNEVDKDPFEEFSNGVEIDDSLLPF